jgi:hypothetical protein
LFPLIVVPLFCLPTQLHNLDMIVLSIAEMGEDGTSTRVLFVYVIWMIRHCFTDKVVQMRQIAGFSGTFLVD